MRSKKFSFISIYLCSLLLMLSTLIMISSNSKSTYSSTGTTNSCSKDAVLQLAKIIYSEVGADCAQNSDENFYMRLTTASIVLNNASRKNGSTWYNKIYSLTDNNYQGYSSYKDRSFNDVVKANQGQILYIAQLVLSGKYNVPTQMTLQAEKSIVERWGTIWDQVYTYSGFYDTYFGYENSLNNVDVFGNTVSNTSKEYFRNLANSLELSDYSSYTVDNICQVELGNQNPNNNQVLVHKVNFYMNDGTNDIYKTIDVNNNNSVAVPADPIRNGYKFTGWQYDSGEVFDSNIKINSTLNLYASWEEIIDDTLIPDSTPSNSSNDINQEVIENAQTGDNHIFIILIGIIALDISIYFYKKRMTEYNN